MQFSVTTRMWRFLIILGAMGAILACPSSPGSRRQRYQAPGWPHNNLTGYLTANGKNFSSPKTHEYHFYEGEPVDFVCYKTTGGFVQLSYTSKDGTHISTDLQPTSSVTLYMKLSASDSDNTVLQCTITDKKKRFETVIRLRLIYKPKNNHENFGFVVNGLILPRIKQKGNQEYYFEYKYYHGERLKIEVVKDDQLYEDISCSVDGKNVPNYLKQYFNETARRIHNEVNMTFNKEQTNTVLICTIKLKNKHRDDHIAITFIYHTPDYNPFIEGLSMGNILMQYTNSTANVIHYDYIGSKTLNLGCFTPRRNKNTTWIYSQKSLSSHRHILDRKKLQFQLWPNQNEALITCSVKSSASDRTTHLKLIRKEGIETTTRIPTTPAVNKVSGTSVTTITVITVVTIVMAAVLLVGGLKVYRHRRVQSQPDSDNGAGNQGYETIPPQAPRQTSVRAGWCCCLPGPARVATRPQEPLPAEDLDLEPIEPPEYDYVYAHRFRARD